MRGAVGVEQATVEDVWFEESGGESVAVVAVRVWKRQRSRCGVCRRRCPGYDAGDGRRRWRTLDLGLMVTFVEADAPRVTCRRPGTATRLRAGNGSVIGEPSIGRHQIGVR